MNQSPLHPRPRETKLAASRHRILNQLFRRNGCSRFDLARRLNINATMVGNYVEQFLAEELLVEDEPVSAPRGRAPVPLGINPDYGCFLGLDFEALRARAVLCDFAGGVLVQREVSFPAEPTRAGVMKRIVSLARQVAKRADRPLLAVGVAAPGQVDCVAGRILDYQLLPDFKEVPVRDRFSEVFDCPVFVEDNIRAVAFGELLRGAGQGCRNFLCLAVRSGVGLGIVIDGKLYNGCNAMAGEVGYTVFPTRTRPRTMTELVSAKGFVEATARKLCSLRSTRERRRLVQLGKQLSLADVVSAAEAGDGFLSERLEQLGTRLGMLTANLANLFSPEKIVLSGEVPYCCDLVRQNMERTFRRLTLSRILLSAHLEKGALGTLAGALGAAYLGFARVYPEDQDTLIAQVMGNRNTEETASIA